MTLNLKLPDFTFQAIATPPALEPIPASEPDAEPIPSPEPGIEPDPDTIPAPGTEPDSPELDPVPAPS